MEDESSKTGSCKIKKLLQNAYNSQNGNMMVNDAKKASRQSKREKKPHLQSHLSHQWVMQSSQVCEGALPMCFAPWYDKIPGGIKKYGKKMKVRLSKNLLNWIAWTTNSRHQDLISDIVRKSVGKSQDSSTKWVLTLEAYHEIFNMHTQTGLKALENPLFAWTLQHGDKTRRWKRNQQLDNNNLKHQWVVPTNRVQKIIIPIYFLKPTMHKKKRHNTPA